LQAINGSAALDPHLGLVLNPVSPLLEYLNVRFLVANTVVPPSAQISGTVALDGTLTTDELQVNTLPVSELLLDSALAGAASVEQGTPVGAVIVRGSDGTEQTFIVRAGLDTAEWAYEQEGAQQSIRHDRPARIARTSQEAPDLHGQIYETVLQLGQPTAIAGLRFELWRPDIKWAIDRVSVPFDGLSAAYRTVYDTDGVRVLEAKQWLPRAYIVHGVQLLSSESAVLERMQEPSFDPHSTVLLEGTPDASDPNLDPTLAADGRRVQSTSLAPRVMEDARVQTDTANRLIVAVDTPSSGFLVLSENYAPGWQALVDGSPERIYRADYAFRAVSVPAGSHQVELRYDSRAFDLGVLLSVATLLVLFPMAVWLWRRDRFDTSVLG
jgi:hypothetical protein